jgi:hypothetical protein
VRDEIAKAVTFLTLFSMAVALFLLAERFVNAKIANDTSIAQDTRRIAESLERRP